MAATTKITITECEDQPINYSENNSLTVRSTTSTASGLRNVMLDPNNVTKIVPPDNPDYYNNLSATTKPPQEKTCTKKCGLTFVDFMPIFKRRNEGWFVSAGYECLSELLDRLNHWLHVNPRWGCRVIETVYYDSGSHFNRTDSYLKKGKYQYELRGLRMWVSPKKKETPPQKIGCIITIPKLKLNNSEPNDFVEGEQLTTDRTLGANNFETLSELISRLNHNLQTDPLEGNIISIECVNIPILNYEIDVERVYYADNMYSDCDKLQLLKVYYEISDKTYHHTIGFKDFRPQNDIVDITSPYSTPTLVKFSKLLEYANEHFKSNTDQHFLNAQTLDIPFTKYVNNIDTQKVSCQEMYYCIDSSSQMRMKYLRTFYTTHSHRRFQVNEHQQFDLQSILFTARYTDPKNGGHGFNHNDNFNMLKARINHWLTTTTPKFLSIETVVTANDSNPDEAIENCLKKMDSNEKHNYFVSFRVYYAGPKVEYDFKAAAKQIDTELHDRQCVIA